MQRSIILSEHNLQKEQPDPLSVLDKFVPVGRVEDTSPFIIFARRLLSVSANSASCERLFSILGNILTKTRNRIGNTVLTDLAEVKMHIRDEHLASSTKSRLKHRFGAGVANNPGSGMAGTAGVQSSRDDIEATIQSKAIRLKFYYL
jgi:hypothetical protein